MHRMLDILKSTFSVAWNFRILISFGCFGGFLITHILVKREVDFLDQFIIARVLFFRNDLLEAGVLALGPQFQTKPTDIPEICVNKVIVDLRWIRAGVFFWNYLNFWIVLIGDLRIGILQLTLVIRTFLVSDLVGRQVIVFIHLAALE